MFKSIDGQLTTVFNKVESINTGFGSTKEEIEDLVGAFNEINASQNFGDNWHDFLDTVASKNQNVANMFQDIAKQGAGATASIKDFYSAILDGNTTGFRNVQSVIETFNSVDPSHQQEFANAVSQTNKNLGTYLSNVEVGSASMAGYGNQLVAITAKTIGLKVATAALNTAISFGITALVGLVVTGISKAISEIGKFLGISKQVTESIEENAQKAREELDSISALYLKYKELTEEFKINKGVKDELSSTTNSLLEALGFEKSQIDELTQGYENLDKAIQQATLDSLKKAQDSLNIEIGAKFKDLQNIFSGVGIWNSDTFTFKNSGKNSFQDMAMLEAVKKMNADAIEFFDESGRGNVMEIKVDRSSIESMKEASQVYFDIIQEIRQNSGLTPQELGLNETFQELVSRYNEINKAVDEYDLSVKSYNENVAKQLYITSLIGKEIPKTKEEFDDYKNTLIETAKSSNDFVGDTNDIEVAVKNVLSSIPEFSKFKTEPEVTVLPSVSADTSKIKEGLSNLKEQINDIFKNTDLFDKAIESLNKGEAIDFDSVMSMVEVDGSLAGKFIKTADGYTIAVDKLIEARQKYTEETKASVQADIESSKQSIKIAEQNIKDLEAKRNAINPASDITKWKAYDDAIKSEKNNIEDLNQVIAEDTLVLGEMERTVSSAESAIEDFSTIVDNASKKQSLLKSAMEDMADTGYISASTYADLIEMGGNFTDCLEVQNGRIVLNIEKLKKLETQEHKNVIAANELSIAELQLAKNSIVSDPTGYLTGLLDKKIAELEEQNALYTTLAEEIYNVKPSDKSSSSTKDDKPQSVLDFEKWVAEQEHKIAMGQLKEDEAYYNEKLKRAEEAYSELADYESDLWKVQEEVYKFREKSAQEAFDKKHKLFEKRVDDLEDYADKLSETSVTSDGTNLTTQEKWQEVAAVYKKIQSEIEREINRIVQTGVEGNEDLREELEKQLEEYADKVTDVFKKAVETEKSLLEHQKSALSDVYDKEIDKIKKQQDEAKKAAEAEIDLIQEKIDGLKEVNDEKQSEYEIEKARQDLEKAGQRTRMTYGSDGTITYKQDDEKIKEAQQNLDKLLLEKQVNALETQKSLLEDMRDKESDSYDKLIEDLESQKEQDERQFDILIQRLDEYLNPNSDTSNSDVWSEIAKMDGASYRNGKWVDKDGTEIDITALLSKADEIVDSNNKVADSNNKTENNVKTGNDNTTADINKTDKNGATTIKDETNSEEVDKQATQTEKVNNQLETAADIIGKIAGSADDFVSTILKTLGVGSVKDLRTYSSNSVPSGNQVLSSQHDTTQWSASRDNYVTNNTNQPVSMSFNGDININNPVGDVKKLANEIKNELHKEAIMQIPNVAMKQIHSNLR